MADNVNTSSEETAAAENAQEPVRRRNLEDKFRDWLKWWPWAHRIFCKHEEIWVYLVVGVLTTIVSWVACFLVEHLFALLYAAAHLRLFVLLIQIALAILL